MELDVRNQASTKPKITKERKSIESDSAPANKKAKPVPSSTKEIGGNDKDGKKGSGLVDVSDIHLDGEDNDSVPIYETAADMRHRMITLFDSKSKVL